MADKIVGMMFAKNEVDIIQTTITEAMKHVDSLFIADDGSTDGTWPIIQYYRQQYPDKIESIQQQPSSADQGQRNSMLNEIRKRYRPEDTWVQTIESDMILYTKDLRATIEKNKREDVSVDWQCLNAVREFWGDIHHFYPHWPDTLQNVMPIFHWLETFSCYTYRPMPKLQYSPLWRPWPNGFAAYHTSSYKTTRRVDMKTANIPMCLHYGYRGPTHMMTKWNRLEVKPRNPTKHGFDYTSIGTLMATCNYFNGVYNRSNHTGKTPEEAWEKRG